MVISTSTIQGKRLRKPLIFVLFLVMLSAHLLQAQDCLDDAIYVTPKGTGLGTKLSPAGFC